MVAAGYQVDRGITLTLFLILLLVCTAQFFKAWQLQKLESKNYVPYWNFMAALLFLIKPIDLGGVFDLYPSVVSQALGDMAETMMVVVVCNIIVNHFRAHYLSLKQDMPNTFIWFFVFMIAIDIPLNLTFNILNYVGNTDRYTLVGYTYGLFEYAVLLCFDLNGFLKLRNMLIETIQLEKPSFTGSLFWHFQRHEETEESRRTRRPSTSGKIDYEYLLRRFEKFHSCVSFLLALATLIALIAIVKVVKSPKNKAEQVNSDVYNFDPGLHAALLPIALFIWWAWIPLDASPEDVSSTKETKISGHNGSGHNGSGHKDPDNTSPRSTDIHSPYLQHHSKQASEDPILPTTDNELTSSSSNITPVETSPLNHSEPSSPSQSSKNDHVSGSGSSDQLGSALPLLPDLVV